MLVLSRRQNDKLVFPNLGITIEVLKIAGRSVRLGVKAPSGVRVFRQEILSELDRVLTEKVAAGAGGESAHRLRNRLNKVGLGLHLLQKQYEMGRVADAERTLENILSEFRTLDEDLSAGQGPSSSSHARRALLVEDDANECELLAGFLRISGFDVDVANDGCDALNYLAARQRPDVVLLDMQMPRCDGPTTLSAIRENPNYQGLKVFGVSGRKPAEVGVSLGPGGVDHWFSKPLNPEVLVARLKCDLEVKCDVA